MNSHSYRLRLGLAAATMALSIAGTALAASSANPTPSPVNSFDVKRLKLGSAGHTGCLPDDNAISNAALNPDGSGTWNATCKGKIYLCSAVALRGDSMSISCAPVAQ